MSTNQIGTLIRCAQVEERRIAFYQEIGLNALQIAGVYEPNLAPTREAHAASDALFELFRKYGLDVPTMFLSYPSHGQTNNFGLVPFETRAERIALSCREMLWGHRYGVKYVTCHLGFLPEGDEDFYRKFMDDLRLLVMFAAELGQTFLFEVGNEPAARLKQMLDDLGLPNAGINFDPANFLIYNSDRPENLLKLIPDRVKVVHCKDANPPEPGATHGRETPLGKGSTNFTMLLKTLVGRGFNGPLIIERELPFGPEQEADVKEAVSLIKAVLAEC